MSKKKLLIIIGLLVLILGFVWLFWFFGRTQEVKKVGGLDITPSVPSAVTGDVFRIDVNFRTGTDGEARAISALSFRLTYDYPGVNPDIQVVDKDGVPSNTVYPSEEFLLSGEWTFPVRSVTQNNGSVVIDFAAANLSTEGYIEEISKTIASIYFRADEVPDAGAFTLEFNNDQTKMMTKDDNPVNILSVPTNLNFSIVEPE
jgi:hypothetical protein